MAEKSGCSRV
ncbi:hypothetical protein YPPY04_3263, partial [Yersinia pestis PY-04]